MVTTASTPSPVDELPTRFLGFKVQPKPPGFAVGKEVPEAQATILSRVLFSWMTPLLLVGYSRPIQSSDIWKLPLEAQATHLGSSLERLFFARVPPSRRPIHLQPSPSPSTPSNQQDDPDSKEDFDYEMGHSGEDVEVPRCRVVGGNRPILEEEDKGRRSKRSRVSEDESLEEGSKPEEGGRIYDQSLLKALNHLAFWRFWTAGIFGICAFSLTSTSPLVSQKLLQYIQISYAYSKGTSDVVPPPIGHGIGLAFALWGMQQIASLLQNQFYHRSVTTGFMFRSALVAVISRKSLRLSGASKLKHSDGQLTNHVSGDASFFEWAAWLAHESWIQPVQIVIGVAILISLLGPSALVGLAVLVLGLPLQAYLFKVLTSTRQQQMKITDNRVRLLQEVLQGIRVIKLLAYEGYFGNRVSEFRRQELKLLMRNCLARATMTSTMAFIPVLSAILSFVTYALSGRELSPAIIFAALAAFNNIRAPLLFLPIAVQNLSDSWVALGRLTKVLLAEEMGPAIPVRPEAPFAISAHGDYSWEAPDLVDAEGDSDAKKAAKNGSAEGRGEELEETGTPAESTPLFQLKDINLDIPRGAFVVVCGRVGSGKSSLVQALIGEMRMTRGSSYLGGSTSYFPQAPWVQNATLRDNITFGNPFPDEDRFDEAVRACALEPDIAMLAHGIETEIGERGINLSGGQKARVVLARAVYANADIALLDDPLSAVDAHVSKLLVDCFTTGPLAKKTRILVTHHLEVLPEADLIITMLDGKIAEIGTYSQLMAADGALSKLVAEHVSDPQQAEEEQIKEEHDIKLEKIQDESKLHDEVEKKDKAKKVSTKSEGALMMKEEREIGAVSWVVYKKYVSSMGNYIKAPAFLGSLILAQTANVGTTILLGKWSESSIPGWSRDKYMGVYAALGFSYSIFTFIGTFVLFMSGVRASFNLFNESFAGVMRTSVGWHDQTPVGRIVSRLSKDITVLDDQLPAQYSQLISMGLNIVGTIALVFYSFPYLGIIFVPLFILYYIFAAFYRATSREVKRVDSLMRSFFYSSFGETLGGVASIRAYRAEERFLLRTEKALDSQSRCFYITIVLQRWLGIRLEALGSLLVLGIGLFGVGFRNTVSPAKLGVVLTYSLSLTQIFSQLITAFAEVEQSLNTAERVIHYGALTPEAPTHTKDDPPSNWPSKGAVEFEDVVLKYRDDLPPVLKGTSFSIKAGEKVGIVGRTGAGKSSLLQALFRIVEISGGKITIDGYDLKTIGLDVLRSKLGIVPQDPLLWGGTVRDNLDPTNEHTDADLISSLRRCNLVASDDASVEVKARLDKFRLDAVVQDEGSNFSAGERQLMALARVVVRNSRIIVLDEATSSVDVETDVAIQNTIRTEFTDQSLITIAHRLSTIAFYDRVIFMDAGLVSEIGPPLELFDVADSAFRSMCDKAALSREDIVRIRGDM